MDTAARAGHQASHFPLHHVHHHDPESARLAIAAEESALHKETEKKKARQAALYAAGRMLVALLFVVSGLAKVVRFEETRAAMADFGVAATSSVLALAILIEVVGGVMLGLGYQVRRAAATLLVYLAVVTVVIHGNLSNDWNRTFALANVAIAGGLLMLSAHGAGRWSADRMLERRYTGRAREGHV